ncbi:NAD(P)H-dependent flavin oxidoreductase [Henriciella litoralis]|uniref:NAD(P)H-dependent flavin oxidoreductase n=1 Tax=Henriciella litoralis TaxID=568102 RepID=UPI000A073D19|nr:nitronate monooxygenase [Henriciella litoralis]
MALHFSTPLTERLGCRLPVIQTAMGWVATSKLVKASTAAGAFGFLAAAVMSPEECEAEIEAIKSVGSAPFGVNVHSFQTGVDRIIDMCIDHEVGAISYGRAPSSKMIEKVKAKGIACVPTIGAAKHAKKAVELGADILVCQGAEGGGHTGATPTWLLLAQVLEMDLGVPVVACGGFKDGRGLAAALAYGADGTAMGTRFMMTSDSPTPEETKTAYLAADVTRIPVSVKLDGLPQRMVLNSKLESLEKASGPGLLVRGLINGMRFRKEMGVTLPDMLKSAWTMARKSDLTLGQTLMAANAPMIIQNAMVKGHPDDGVLPSGQVAGLINDLPSCADLLASIEVEASERLNAMQAKFPTAAE